jgi:hypothetical protein
MKGSCSTVWQVGLDVAGDSRDVQGAVHLCFGQLLRHFRGELRHEALAPQVFEPETMNLKPERGEHTPVVSAAKDKLQTNSPIPNFQNLNPQSQTQDRACRWCPWATRLIGALRPPLYAPNPQPLTP